MLTLIKKSVMKDYLNVVRVLGITITNTLVQFYTLTLRMECDVG